MPPRDQRTDPIDQHQPQTAPRLTIAPTYSDPTTGALWVHQDYSKVREDWEDEQHISPPKGLETFGDVESWAAFVRQFAGAEPYTPLLTWSESGLRAVLDYHSGMDEPGRCQWRAEHPFRPSVSWKRWSEMANNRPRSQQELLEFLDDNAPEIIAPEMAAISELIRNLRVSVNLSAESELKADGSTHIAFSKDKVIQGGADLPSAIRIAIPLLKGHYKVDSGGKRQAVLYELEVKLRTSASDQGKVSFRLTIPRAEQAWEMVYEDRVTTAEAALGSGQRILRGAGSQ